MKINLAILIHVLLSSSLMGDILHYEELISRTIDALSNVSLLTSPGFTNEVSMYRLNHTDVQSQCAAQIAESLALLWRFEAQGDLNAIERQVSLASNVVHSVTLPADSWLRVTGEFTYLCGLNALGKPEEGFVVTTNALRRIESHPPNLSATNFWKAVVAREGCTNASPLAVFQLNAALEMIRLERLEDVAVYTNSLPLDLLNVLRED